MKGIPLRLAMNTRARFLILVLLTVLGLGLVLAVTGCSVIRITYATPSTRVSQFPSLSANGRRIAFSSDSDFLQQGVVTNQFEIWLYDMTTLTYTRITTASASNRGSYEPSLSADGTKVAFRSDSDFLSQGIQDNQYEIWVYDLTTPRYTRVTTSSNSVNRRSEYPSLSENGTKVAFDSDSDILSQGILQERFEIWVYDLTTMRYTRVTTVTGGGGIRNSRDPSLSADGARVAFESSSNFPGHPVTFGNFEIFVCDLATMQYTRVTTATGGGQRQSQEASLDADGTRVAFRSDSSFPSYTIPDDQFEIWMYDIPTLKYTRVTTATGAGFRLSERPSLNADGTRVAFDSDSDLLNTGTITDNQFEVWLYNTSAMTYTLLTLSSDTATPSNRNSRYPSISSNGIWVAFQSDSDFLGQGIPQGQYEIWLYDPLQNKVYLPVVLRVS